MTKFSKLFFSICILLVSNSIVSQTKPNILIIHTDDLGYHDLSITGSQLYDTPEIDKLATESVQFTNAYSSYPRCTPSRYGMMTATYPVNENKGYMGGIPENKNFIKQFDKAGYNTYYVGKWHVGEGESSAKGFGYTETYASGGAGGVASRSYPFNVNKKGVVPARYTPVPNIEEDGNEGDFSTDLLTDAAINFIKNNPKNKPFLAVLAFYAVHTPIEAKPEEIARNKKQLTTIDFGNVPAYKFGDGRQKMRQDSPAYAGMVENVDENVAKILNTLKEMGIEDNTIIVFSSDHGGLSNSGTENKRELATTNYPLRAGKGWLYEGGIRVPLFVKWGNNFTPRVDDKSIILGMDLFPTLLDLALNDKIEDIDGKSYKKILKDKEDWKDRTVFWNELKSRPSSTGDNNASVIRSGDYKLLYFLNSDVVELYNLKDDEGELNDLSKKMPEKTEEMMVLLTAWKEEYLVPEKTDMLKNRNKSNKSKNSKK